MNAVFSYVLASVIAFFSLLVLPVAAQAATASRPSDETTVAAVVNTGDVVIVNTNDAPLMVGRAVLARLSGGQKLQIVRRPKASHHRNPRLMVGDVAKDRR
jgi:hypothetical protein